MLVPLRLPQYSLSRSPQQLDLVAVEEWEQSRSPTFALVVMVSSDPPRRPSIRRAPGGNVSA
jgi:hypothetical protein